MESGGTDLDISAPGDITLTPTGNDVSVTGNLGASGNLTIDGNTILLNNLPEHNDEAAATSAGLAQNTVYKTSTGELRIKL